MPNRSRPSSMRSKRSGGPRSAHGKAIASRNALRHGFSAELHRRPQAPEKIERLAQAIVGDDKDPAVSAIAFKIAEDELFLSEIATHKVWVVERLREPYANPLTSKDNSGQLEIARAMQMWLAERDINARVPGLLEKYELRMLVEELKERFEIDGDEPDKWLQRFSPEEAVQVYEQLKARGWRSEYDFFIPNRLMELMEESEDTYMTAASAAANRTIANEDRDEFEALDAAIRDLVRLDRYQQRAWVRQKRAILELVNLKLARRFSEEAQESAGVSRTTDEP